MTPTFVTHLLSGGMDSVVLGKDLLDQGCKMYCAIFNYGQKHFHAEAACARSQADKWGIRYRIIEVSQLLGSQLTGCLGTFVVPNRNAILISLAVNLAQSIGSDCVTFAANADDNNDFPDCRGGFVKAYNSMLRTTQIGVEVCAPYLLLSKKAIAEKGRLIGVDLDNTYSCYIGGPEHCGNCPACKKRKEALENISMRPN